MKNCGKQANFNTRGQTPTVTQPQRKVVASAARTLHKCVVQKKKKICILRDGVGKVESVVIGLT